ncbi:MAG: hypothetical protein IJ257_01885 [Treponema sp.]|nr:hypothetical protein [Treponema sp.]
MRKDCSFNFHISVLILLFSFFAGFPLFAADLSPGEEKALSYIRELTFEITRYNLTGLSSDPESVKFAEISKIGSKLLGSYSLRKEDHRPHYVCEYYFPEKTGIIDSTFCPEDLYAASDFFSGIDNVEEAEVEEEVPQYDWVDLVLQGLQASSSGSEKIPEEYSMFDGQKVLEMLEKGDSRGIEAQSEDKAENDSPKEFTYEKNDGSLRRFSYDGEQFTAWREGENTVLVNFYGDKLLRKNFDSLYRLVKSERFKTAASAKKAQLESEISYEYEDESNIPKKSVEEEYVSKKRKENLFDANGRLLSLLEQHYEEREIKQKGKKSGGEAEKETLLLDDKKTSRIYDEKGRMTEEEIITWNYKKMFSGRYSVSKRTIKNDYDYTAVTEENNLPPDLKFYEDGELHLERKYTDTATYSEKLFFDGDFSVEVRYENGLKKTEIIYLNDVEQRRRNFEY